MKIVQINSTCESGSIGKICKAVSQLLTKNNIENYILYTMVCFKGKNLWRLWV